MISRFPKTLSSFLCAGLLAGTVLTPHLATARPPEPARIASTAGNVTRATLPNGLRVVVVQNRLAPVVTTELNYLVGSANAPDGFPGTAHALEHMMFRGSKGLDKDQLAALAARLGGSYNADTTEDVTQYFYTAPAEDLGLLLHIEALRMNGLTLSEADWDKERGAIEQEVSRDLSSPVYRYISQLRSILYKGTPYEHDALGTRPSFDKTDAALLRSFYGKWYAPNNAILVIVGDVDPQATLDKVKQAFGTIPSRALPERAPVNPAPPPAQALSFPTDLPIGIATIAYPMPGLTSKEFATADILSDVLGSQRGALYQLVPAGKALFAGFEFSPIKRAGMGIAVAAFPKGGNSAKALSDMKDILADIRVHGVPAELVEAAKTKEVAQLGFSANSISGLAESWSTALAFQNLSAPDDIAAAYRAVTPDDVNHLAARILDPSRAITAILTPEESGKPQSGKGFGGAESFASAPDKPVALPDWASEALAKLDLPPPVALPSVQTLPNGLTLIVHPSNVSQTIQVAGEIRNNPDLQVPKGKEGLAGVTEDLFSYGTTKHDRLAFHKALDDVPAWESAGTGFSLSIPAAKFDDGMALLAENELHPAFPEQAFQVVKMQAAQAQAGELQSPGYLFGRAIKTAISPKDDPTLRQATPQTIAALSLADVHAYFSTVWRPDMTTIVITGDITPEKARATVEKTFGDWKASGPKPDVDLPARPDSRTSRAHVPDKSNVQDTVALAESLSLTAANPDRYVLMVGDEILGGGFSSRLYRDLRVKTGYVYSVSSGFTVGRTRGGYSVSYGADPGKVSLAREAALRDIRAIQNVPVTDDELTIAKSGLLRGLPLERASLDSIAGTYLRLIRLGLPLNTPDIAAQAFYKATAADVQAAFRKWVRPDDLAEIVKGPVPEQ
ncbi:M16 family metallopeptidase [Acetobacter oeni]|uniref:Proteinase n=1 Tax=Acetobacter oeni TaxID=304077 RepID=A0A511XNB6_9PROT|nr:pitrilysin family protein [Acetobacter oeni]MBB3883286.1 zinc protease [Acetobacter oeni]NHO19351.1 insulinase family protein [Acetobacter oeni]GBR10175.1 peptidase [Acetobacter oeni LMG 21952]GEN64443.1 proteinase [Acetobacter oeni]